MSAAGSGWDTRQQQAAPHSGPQQPEESAYVLRRSRQPLKVDFQRASGRSNADEHRLGLARFAGHAVGQVATFHHPTVMNV